METKEKLNEIAHAYTSKEVKDERKSITVFNEEKLSPEAYEALKAIQFKLNEETGTFELDYEIMSDACGIVSELTPDTIEECDVYEMAMDSASVYTATRLSWLNLNNQDEISNITREFECDIQNACAVWYERQVQRACEMLIEWVRDNDETA